MYQYTEGFIANTIPREGSSAPKFEEWNLDRQSKNVLSGLAILICRLASHDTEKCSEYLKGILRMLFQPLKDQLDWIRKE